MESYINSIFNDIRSQVEKDDESREKIIKLSRSAIRKCSESIRAVHRRELNLASDMIESTKNDLLEIVSILPTNGLFENNVSIAFQEYIEALELFHFVSNDSNESSPLLSLKFIQESIPIPYVAYLHGICDLVGELRRFTLDSIRLDDIKAAERSLNLMDEIFSQLITLDYPNALVPGIRRKTDLIRNLLEKTRGDLTFTHNRIALVEKLDKVLKISKVDSKIMTNLMTMSEDEEEENE